MKSLIIIHLTAISLLIPFFSFSQNTSKKGNSRTANCAPPQYFSDLDLNNVRARIHTGSDMWWDLAGNSVYEIPKGSGKNSLSQGAIWIGGIDDNNQLRLAAQRFRDNGSDFYTGPLDLINAETDTDECFKWDTHFKLNKRDVEEFRAWFNSNNKNVDFPGYQIPTAILNWPWKGDAAKGQANYLAPFVDVNNDGIYNPSNDGDYPKFDLNKEIDCQQSREAKLYGDQTLFWIFNDKGNAHFETGGIAMGLEIHGQAFAFATNDEINNMTFYNYRMFNRSVFTLNQTYFGINAEKFGVYDFVACDVSRGIGYRYHGDDFDNSNGSQSYGANPPAIGIDFFEGPFQDNDGIDNAFGINAFESINGTGYGDSIVDNERLGMSHFLYFRNGSGPYHGFPDVATDYYNYLSGKWLDGSSWLYGGIGFPGSGGVTNIPARYFFPGDSDKEYFFGTNGQSVPPWSEESSGNVPFNRRFVQSVGPFTLKPGEINEVTLGVVWGRGDFGSKSSVLKMKEADDKAQALFNNCFKLLDGPDAPELKAVELDKQIILQLENLPNSNNFNENYEELDYSVPEFLLSLNSNGETIKTPADRTYKFQGYQIFQLRNKEVGLYELYNIDKARLVAQSDIRDSVSTLINYTYDAALGISIPNNMTIEAANRGVQKTYSITQDMFGSGNKYLSNHKEYYYVAIAYGHNEYEKYNHLDPNTFDGQKKPYISSRRTANGSLQIITAVPHSPIPKNGGTVQNTFYGDGPHITRIEGKGNGGIFLDLVKSSENEIIENYKADFITYEKRRGPINVKVTDPLNIKALDFELKILMTDNSLADNCKWQLKEMSNPDKIYLSEKSIKVGNEQIFEEFGFSITIQNALAPGNYAIDSNNGLIGSSIEFSNPNLPWLTGIKDKDDLSAFDWIKSGTFNSSTFNLENDYQNDPNEIYENLDVPFFAPYGTVSAKIDNPGYPTTPTLASLDKLVSVDVVITSDKSKWTRCPVIESQIDSVLAEGAGSKGRLRDKKSVDKDGNPDNSGTKGLGWFPGYAIDVESGERLNMAFSEDSWMIGENGRDMIWNPSKNITGLNGEFLGGGKHFIYVFANQNTAGQLGIYDEGALGYSLLTTATSSSIRNFWRSCTWVGFPILAEGFNHLSTDVRIKLRVSKPYEKHITASNENNHYGLYRFSTSGMEPSTNIGKAEDYALVSIQVVPNPYYAYSEYEKNQAERIVKIINLPDECYISIYTLNGTLVKKFNKNDKLRTAIEWDLTNQNNRAIDGGVYLIHVEIPGVGEKVLKWFGAIRKRETNF